MAYSVLATVVTGTPISSTSFGNAVKDNFDAAFPLGVDGWTTFVPTLVQLGAVTKTGTYAKYQRIGRTILAQVNLAVTGSGTGANAVAVGLPVTAAANQVMCGTGYIYDVSANFTYKATVEMNSTTTVLLRPTTTTANDFLGVAVFTAGLAVGDLVTYCITYESAS